MTNFDLRWHQRLKKFEIVLKQLTEAIELAESRALTNLEQQGVIQAFEYNFELSWNVIKDFYEAQGETNIQGSRDAFRLAFNRGLVANGDVWMQMVKSRALTSHTYNQATAIEILDKIQNQYFALFNSLRLSLNHEKVKNA